MLLCCKETLQKYNSTEMYMNYSIKQHMTFDKASPY